MSGKKVHIESESQWHELRAVHIGASEGAALWGVSPYRTPEELFYIKRGDVPEPDLSDNMRVKCGIHLEPSIASLIADVFGFKEIRKADYYIIHETVRGMGASLDYEVKEEGKWVPLEIKNIDYLTYKHEWLKNGDVIEAPLHMQLQVQHQMECAGADYAYIGFLVGGNEPNLIRLPRHDKVIKKHIAKIEKFWRYIASGMNPLDDQDWKFDWEKNVALVRKLTEEAGGEVQDRSADKHLIECCAEYAKAQANESEAKKRKERWGAEIRVLIGNCDEVYADEYKISARKNKAGNRILRITERVPQMEEAA